MREPTKCASVAAVAGRCATRPPLPREISVGRGYVIESEGERRGERGEAFVRLAFTIRMGNGDARYSVVAPVGSAIERWVLEEVPDGLGEVIELVIRRAVRP